MRAGMMVAALLLAGCSSPELPETVDETPEWVPHQGTASIGTTAILLGTGVPSVQCEPNAASSLVQEWDLQLLADNATDIYVTNLTFELTAEDTVLDADLFVTNPQGQGWSATGSTAQETITLPGRQTTGTYTMELRACLGYGRVSVDGYGTVHWMGPPDDVTSTPMP